MSAAGRVAGAALTRPSTRGSSAGSIVGRQPLQLGQHERVEVAVEDGRGVARLVAGPEVLDHLVGMEDVAPDLVAPAGLDVLALERPELGLLLLERPLEQAGLEDLDRRLLVLGLRPFVLALGRRSRSGGGSAGRPSRSC